MAYITGLATEPVFDQYVDIEKENLQKKLVSVYQDMCVLIIKGVGEEANTETRCTGNDGKTG